MKYILSVFISFTLILFLLSVVALETSLFDTFFLSFKEEVWFTFYLGYTKLLTSLILISFIITQAKYSLILNPNSKYKKEQLYFGVSLGILIVVKFLFFFYISAMLLDTLKPDNKKYYGSVKAKNHTKDALIVYIEHGVSIEYYDENNTIQKYVPSPPYIGYRETTKKVDAMNKQYDSFRDYIPVNISLTFLTIIFSFLFASFLAKRKMTKEKN